MTPLCGVPFPDVSAKKDELAYYFKELVKVGVTRRVFWDEYRQSNPDGYRYTQFCRHLGQDMKIKNPSMVLQYNAGEKLFIDFGGKETIVC